MISGTPKKQNGYHVRCPGTPPGGIFRRQNDGNLLLYVTTKYVFENIVGDLPVAPPLAVGLQVPQEKLTIKHMAMNEKAM